MPRSGAALLVLVVTEWGRCSVNRFWTASKSLRSISGGCGPGQTSPL